MARLIGFFVVFALFLAFMVLNLGDGGEYKCNINMGFHVFYNVPIYISVFVSLFIGMIFSLPFLASMRKKKDKISDKPEKPKSRGKNKHSSDNDEIPGVNGPYGIN